MVAINAEEVGSQSIRKMSMYFPANRLERCIFRSAAGGKNVASVNDFPANISRSPRSHNLIMCALTDATLQWELLQIDGRPKAKKKNVNPKLTRTEIKIQTKFINSFRGLLNPILISTNLANARACASVCKMLGTTHKR